ncbi:MAG: competence protein ComEC [Actinomycetota bacterium]|nr:competence protein ComEC [Actinomycetota bacterium]
MTAVQPAGSAGPPPAGPDLRLAVPALGCWLGAFLATSPRAWRAVSGPIGAASAAALLVAACALLLLRGRRRERLVVAAALLGLLAGSAMGAVRLAAVQGGDLRAWARDGASARVVLRLSEDPRSVAGTTSGSSRRGSDTVLVRGRVVQLSARGRVLRHGPPVLVIALDRAQLWRWRTLLPGQTVRTSGQLRAARQGEAVAALILARSPPRPVADPPRAQRAAGRLRAGLRKAAGHLPAGPRGLLPGLVLGDTSRMPPELSDDFRTAGLTHLVAVSGANVAIVVGFLLLLGRWCGVRGLGLPALGLLGMLAFVVLARPQPSVLRAAVMGGVGLLALATGRRRASVAALSGAVLVLVLLDPWLARSYGFVLSVLATGALVLVAPSWADGLSRGGLPRAAAAAIAVPLAAQAVCAPVITLLSGQVSLVAVPANLLAAPAVAPATVLGVLATAASAVSPPTARLLATVAGLPTWWVVEVAQRSASAPLAALGWTSSVTGALVLAVLTVVAAAAVRRVRAHPRLAAAVAVLLAVALAVPAASPGWPPRGWLLVACDVGQGDALVLSAGPAGAVVVDAGPDPRLVDRCLRGLGVRRVPLVVLTHLHADHVEGLPGVLRGRRVGEVLVGPYDEPAGEHVRVLRWSAAARVPVRRTTVGERRQVGPLRWEVLWPARVIEGEGSTPNNASIVLLVRSDRVRMLLTGDVEPAAQQALLRRWRAGPVDVLKVAHHGSAHQSARLLAALRPRVALISVGVGNDYGHPAPRTLRALRMLGALVRRTDRDGTLAVVGPRAHLRVVARRR